VDKVRRHGTTKYNPLQPTPIPGAGLSMHSDQFEESVVVDVIVNNAHDLYATDGYNVGMVKFRRLVSNAHMSEEQLYWAYPMHANVSQYPLIGELVYVFKALNRWYYLAKFNVSNRVTAQDLPELLTETDVSKDVSSRAKDYNRVVAPRKQNTQKTGLGHYFVDKPDVYRLKHFEGDIVFEGRSGQSVRFGTARKIGQTTANSQSKITPFKSTDEDQSPNLLMRVGPYTGAQRTVDTTFGQVLEDINRDASSIWMVSDQIVPLELATAKSQIQGMSTQIPSVLDKNQIIYNSDRIVLNTKKGKILLHSFDGIHQTSVADTTVDTNRDYITWTNRHRTERVVGEVKLTTGRSMDVSVTDNIEEVAGRTHTTSANILNVVADKIHIGSRTDEQEPLVLGETLRTALEELIESFRG
jgi:hypothetical protein